MHPPGQIIRTHSNRRFRRRSIHRNQLLHCFSAHGRRCSHAFSPKIHWRWQPADLIERNRYRNSDRIAKFSIAGRIRTNRYVARRNRNVAGGHRSDGRRLNTRGRRSIEYRCPAAFPGRVDNDLLDHHHAAVFDHAEYEQKENRCNDGELNGRCPPSLFSE